MWSYSSYAKQCHKCNGQSAFFIGIKEWSIALECISWLKAHPAKCLINGDWMLSQFRTTSSRRGDFVVLGTAKPTHRKSIPWPITRGRDVSERILMEFHIVSNEIQKIVIRNSKLAGLRESASQWINWHKKTTPIAHRLTNARDIGKTRISHIKQIGQKCTDETPIRLSNSSHNYEPSPPRIWRRTTWTHPFSTVPKVAFVFFQYLMVAVEWKLVELIFFNLLYQNRLQLMAICCNRRRVWTEHPHTSHFLVFARMSNDVSHDIGSRC